MEFNITGKIYHISEPESKEMPNGGVINSINFVLVVLPSPRHSEKYYPFTLYHSKKIENFLHWIAVNDTVTVLAEIRTHRIADKQDPSFFVSLVARYVYRESIEPEKGEFDSPAQKF